MFNRVRCLRMNHLQNKGFTLIELMVAIVIMGILVAVGVPKLTGAIAKSKASEVAPAATAYIKLQSAYVMEHKRIGTWKRIGYSKPKSGNFSYDRGDIKSRTKIDDLGEAGLVGWIATNKVSMRDCNQGNTWKVILQQGGTDSDGSVKLNFETEVSDAACAALAGDWTKVSKETQVAATTPEKTYKYSQGLFLQTEKGEDGKLALGKAIISGRNSSNMSNWAGYEVGTDMSVYGFEGYVYNNAMSTAEKASLTELFGGKEYYQERILTELYDVSGSVKPSAGIYKAKQTLYYGSGAVDPGFVSLNLYGTRDVFVKVDKVGAAKEFCADENCSQVIGVADDWITSDVQQITDPYEQVPAMVLESSPFANNQLKADNPIAFGAIDTKNGKWHSVEGIDGSVICVSPQGASETQMRAWLEQEEPASTGKNIRVVTQVFANKPEARTLYAATVTLYYGTSAIGYDFFERRKVYAAMSDKGEWVYFSDYEATSSVKIHQVGFWQSDMGKM